MDDWSDLDKRRQEVTSKIEKAFPKERHTKGKAKLTRGGYPYESKILREVLEGKSWRDVVSEANVVYYLSDIDFMAALSERAYDYYFPAFLVATTYVSNSWIYYTSVLDYMERLSERCNASKLEALVAWLELQLEYLRRSRLRLGMELGKQIFSDDKQASSIKATLQKIRQLIDEKHASS